MGPLSYGGPADTSPPAGTSAGGTPGPSPTQPGRTIDNPYRNIGQKDRGPQPIASSSSFGRGEARTFTARPDSGLSTIVHGRPSLRRPATAYVLNSVPRPASPRPRFFLFRGY